MLRSFLLAALVAPALAGCLAAPLAPTALPLGPAALGYAYLCPGEGGEPGEAPCLKALARDDATLQEPFAAAHPLDPDILAVGVNFGPPLAERAQGLPDDSHVCRLGVYVTEDAGASWREAFAPPPEFRNGPLGPTPNQCAGDPALVFDDAGRLHVTGIATSGNLPGPLRGLAGDNLGYVTYYVRSDDLGRTWGESVVLSANGSPQDRNWLTRDPSNRALYAVWQNTAGPLANWTTEVAWTLDGGATWRNQAPEQRPRCHTDGPVVVRGMEALVSCSNTTSEEETRVRVYAFDPASGDVELRSELVQQGFWPFLTALPSGRLALQYSAFDGDTQILWSGDGGRTWQSPTSLRGVSEGAWDFAHAYWAEADRLGGYHLITRLTNIESLAPAGPTIASYELRHLVLDEGGARVQETTLEAWKSTDPPKPRPAQTLGDHYYGIAWGAERALLAYTRDAEVKLTLVQPTGVGPAVRAE